MQRNLKPLLLAAVLFAACALGHGAKRPMTFFDVIEMRTVEAGTISPDGKWVLYAVSVPRWKAGKNYTELFIAPTDGSSLPHQLTFTPEKNETSPQWAPDSRTLGFLSDRDGVNQLFVMRRDGGEARRVSNHKDGVSSFSFSRNGKWLAYCAGKPEDRQIWLSSMEGEKAPVQLTRHATSIAAWVWASDSARLFFTAPDADSAEDVKRREKKFDVKIADQPKPPAHLWSLTLGDKPEQRVEKRWTSGDYSVENFTVSRDGAWLAFRAHPDTRYLSVTDEESDVYLMSLETGTIRRITSNHVAESSPVFSPDSQWIAFTAPDNFEQMRNDKIYVAPVAGGELRKLLPEWDHNARGISWAKDSKALYFSEGIGVNAYMFAVSLAEGKLRQLTNGTGVLRGSLDPESGLFLLNYSNPAQPADYYVARPGTIDQRDNWVRVSRANPQVEELSLGDYETVRWQSTDGHPVEGILVKPLGYEPGKKYPLIVQVHGGPASAEMNGFSARYSTYTNVFAAAGYAVFQPNYRGSDNYGEKFRTQIAGDYFRPGFDDIMTGVDYLIQSGIADPGKLGMMGWSAGGHWSNWTLTHTNRFKAISTGAGASNWISMYAETDVQAPREFYFKGTPWENWDHYTAESPLRYIQNAKTPTLIHVGEADQRVPKPQSDELYMALKKLGVPVEYIVYPGMPHGITEPRYQMVKMVAEFNWFEKWIRGKPGWFDWKPLLDSVEEAPQKEAQLQKEIQLLSDSPASPPQK